MLQEAISGLIVQFYLYKAYLSEVVVHGLTFVAHGLAEATTLTMLLSLATTTAFLFIGEVKGFLPHKTGFMVLEVSLPSLSVLLWGVIGWALVGFVMSTARFVNLPPWRLNKARRRLSL